MDKKTKEAIKTLQSLGMHKEAVKLIEKTKKKTQLKLTKAEVQRAEAALIENTGVIVITKKKKKMMAWSLDNYLAMKHRMQRHLKKRHEAKKNAS